MTEQAGGVKLPIEITQIMAMLPHRYPFLLVDRVVEFEPNKRVLAIKNVTVNEPFFTGHFPGHPVMPGVLVIEAMAQASGILTQLSNGIERSDNQLYYLVRVDKARFARTVVPGDQLKLEVKRKRLIRRMGLYDCRALVGDQEVASAEILCAAPESNA
ncbi:MAG TPA: 3-hydroxyacyl-ACP dehydratase FabZ [Pseudomonadota bacterium]|nr:3-hydroxyacyl-ACP dehydratase FabZ [Pseudomonadota bacterium]